MQYTNTHAAAVGSTIFDGDDDISLNSISNSLRNSSSSSSSSSSIEGVAGHGFSWTGANLPI